MTETSTEVYDFLKRRFWQRRQEPLETIFMEGNCYYFAKMLCERFKEFNIYYMPILNHFVAGDGETFYDYDGEVELEEFPIRWEMFQLEEPLESERILRDCIE